MAKVAMFAQIGGPEVIEWQDVDLPPPGEGEVEVRNTAVGLNYIDAYFRSGIYPTDLPSGLGSEAAGVVMAVGKGVTGFARGDRVGTFGPTRGAYATERNVPAADLFHLPDSVDDRTAAALMLKGATAEFLIERCAKVQAGQSVLVHAAAGGVGHILVGWLKAIGATVIASVGSEEKAERTRKAGADHVILHKSEDIAQRVREITGGQGVPVVLDGVGGATWKASLDSAAKRGLVVTYGNAGGVVDRVNLGVLASKGSLFVTRPTLFTYYEDAAEKQAGIDRLFAMLAKGAFTPDIGQTYPLLEAAEAHRAMEAGETSGSTVLLP